MPRLMSWGSGREGEVDGKWKGREGKGKRKRKKMKEEENIGRRSDEKK